MKKVIITLLLLITACQLFAQLPSKQTIGNKLSISFNKNIELLGFAYFIAYEATNIETQIVTINGEKMPEKDWQTYGYSFYKKYRQYANNRYLVSALSVSEHLWLSNIIPLLLNVNDFPDAHISPETDINLYLAFSPRKDTAEARRNAEIFLSGCNEFYKEVDFDSYLLNSKVYYDAAITQIKENMVSSAFMLQMEVFYRKKFDSYSLTPSLTLPKTIGFSAKYGSGSREVVCNVFGAIAMQSIDDVKALDMGFGSPDKLRELSVHEFGHAFINPAFDSMPAGTLSSSTRLFKPIEIKMAEQGYNTWAACVNEHIVRAGEILIAERIGNKASAAALRKDYIDNRKFIYIPLVIDELENYSKRSKQTLQQTIELIAQRLKNYQAN